MNIVKIFESIGYKPIWGEFVNSDDHTACILGALLIEKYGEDRARDFVDNCTQSSAFTLGPLLNMYASRAQGLNDGWEGLPFRQQYSQRHLDENTLEYEYAEGYKFAQTSYTECCKHFYPE